MTRVLHISDLHFGPPYVTEVGEAALRLAHDVAPDVIVVSGDLTQRARPEQFADAHAFLQRLPRAPMVVVPGNHDVPLFRVVERFFRPREQYQRHFKRELDGVLRFNDTVVIWLDSTSPRRAISNGRIHWDQLDFCEHALREAPQDAYRVVVSHHHFAPAPDYERDQVMPKAKRAMDLFVRLGVDMVLGGHLHRAYIGNSLDVYPGPERDHGVIIVQCGTTTSRRGRGKEREKNSLNVIDLGGGLIRITHYIHFHDSGGFAPVSRHIFPRPGARLVGFDGDGAAVRPEIPVSTTRSAAGS